MKHFWTFLAGILTGCVLTGAMTVMGVFTFIYTYIITPFIVLLQNIPGVGQIIT